MWVLGLFLGITSFWRRLLYLSRYGRQDIHLFAAFAAREFAAPTAIKLHKLPNDFYLWVKRVEKQLALEAFFPRGARLGTFAHSPVLQLRDHFDQPLSERSSPWSVEGLDDHYRQVTGLSASIDTVMQNDAGYSVGSFAKELFSLLQVDAVLAYLLLNREIQLAAAHHAGRVHKLFLLKTSLIDQFSHLRGNIIAHGAAVAMHEYLWSIVTEIRKAKEIDDQRRATKKILNALNLKGADLARRLNPATKDLDYDMPMDAVSVSVAALYRAANDGEIDRERGLDEVYLALGRKGGKGGDRTDQPLVHYYGLTWDRLLALGTFEIVVVMIGLHRKRRTHGVHPKVEKVVRPAGRLTRDIVWAAPNSLKSEWDSIQRRLHFLMMCYLPPAHNKGGGGRFDPSLLLDPTKDWKAYDKGARRNPLRRIEVARSFTEIVDTIRYRLTLASRMFAVATKLVVARPNELPHHTERRKRGSKVAALLASSLTMVTSDPLFIPLLKNAVERAGFEQTRGTKRKKRGAKTATSRAGADASESCFDAGLADAAGSTAFVDEVREPEPGRHWGRKVPTRLATRGDGSVSA